MTDDPLADRAALLSLPARGLLVLVLCTLGSRPAGGWGSGRAEAAPGEQPANGEADARRGAPRTRLAPEGPALESFDGRGEDIDGDWGEVGVKGLVVAGGVEHAALSPRAGGGGVLFGPLEARLVPRDRGAPGEPEAPQRIVRRVDPGRGRVDARPEAPRAARSAEVSDGETMAPIAAAAGASLRERGEGSWQVHGSAGRGLSRRAFAARRAGPPGAEPALNLDGAISTPRAERVGDRRFEPRGEAGTINALVLRT